MPPFTCGTGKTSLLLPVSAGLLGSKPTGVETVCTYISEPRSTPHL